MTTYGFYPGTFNPWHQGHKDVLDKALKIFDVVIIAHGINADKTVDYYDVPMHELVNEYGDSILFYTFQGLLVDALNDLARDGYNVTGVVRGLRNGNDLQYEMNQQYWNEDLGLTIPIVYFITDKALAHISSSAIRGINRVKNTITS